MKHTERQIPCRLFLVLCHEDVLRRSLASFCECSLHLKLFTLMFTDCLLDGLLLNNLCLW